VKVEKDVANLFFVTTCRSKLL